MEFSCYNPGKQEMRLPETERGLKNGHDHPHSGQPIWGVQTCRKFISVQ
jgi:hypothetical protein